MMGINTYDFNGKRAIVRVDFNVPLDKTTNLVQDDKRIRAAIPTIKHILSHGGSVVLLSHFGRPKNGPESKFSLRQIVNTVSDLLSCPVIFCEDFNEASSRAAALISGEVMLLENVRFHPGETQGDLHFASLLASLGNCYVNDAFGSAHRAHASTTQIASFFPNDRMMGFLMEAELLNAKRILKTPTRPFTAIVGGAKVSDKILIIEQLLDKVDNLIIGGGMTYTFSLAEGGKIGKSISEPDKVDLAKSLLEKAKAKGVNIYMPLDNVCADDFNNNANRQIVNRGEIPDGWEGLDIGPKSIELFQQVVAQSKTILWNGPIGVFEFDQFSKGTETLAHAIANSIGFSLAGGGDTIAALEKFGMIKNISYISTAGGAFLEFVEGKKLPAIEILEKRSTIEQ